MIYEFQSKNDFSAGASLIVNIPQQELDKNALYTISADKPEFIVPFRYRSVDGEIEFVYQIGSLSPLQFLPASYLAKEYAQLWLSILGPLLECGDWFMKPYSFVLSSQQLYYDENKKTVCYVYIPSNQDCSDCDTLKEMVAEVASSISVDDSCLENKVLRMIMKDFNPKDFLQMLRPYVIESAQPAAPTTFPAPVLPVSESVSPAYTQSDNPSPEPTFDGSNENAIHSQGEIIINIPADKKTQKNEAINDNSLLMRIKEPKKPKTKESFISRVKRAAQQEVIIG